MEEIRSHFINNLEWWMFLVIAAIFCALTYAPFLFATLTGNKEAAERVLSRRWMMCVAWFCLLVLVVMLDGEFLNSGIADTIAVCSAVLACIFTISGTFERISLKKGDAELHIGGKKVENKKDKTKNC